MLSGVIRECGVMLRAAKFLRTVVLSEAKGCPQVTNTQETLPTLGVEAIMLEQVIMWDR